MADIPCAVLSERFEDIVDGRRLLAAVFVTFQFDPEFFEQQVLPVFLNVSTSHAEAIRRVQLEDALKEVPNRVAVYYDQNGLDLDAKPARLDVSRVPVIHRTGIFHSKNIFALVEHATHDDTGHHPRTLIAACTSANLTRSGWWENVEVCHIDTIEEGAATRLKGDLIGFLDGIERRVGEKSPDGHESIRAIKTFLRSTEQRLVRSSEGRLHTHFFDGATSVPEFLRSAAGGALDGLNLEVISPYFDIAPESKPLIDLIDTFNPKEVRVFLPRKDTGEALCSPELFQWIELQPRIGWSRLPKDVTRGGKADGVKGRVVHAKVYRFFQISPKREYLFIGSANLTGPAHRRGGNLETGFLVELEPHQRPDWWLEPDRNKPAAFEPKGEDEGTASTSGTRLSLRYSWDSKRAEVYWDHGDPSPTLAIERSGVPMFSIETLQPRLWVTLDAKCAVATEQALLSTSIFTVTGDRPEPASVLVQEEGMAQRPSLLFDLSLTEILRYWAILTTEQRAAFLEAHAPELALIGEGSALVTKHTRLVDHDSFFDKFAGIFISFGQFEKNVSDYLASCNLRAAHYRLFGQKYDSLGRLLSRIREDESKTSDGLIEHYVMALCARQTVNELYKQWPDFFREHVDENLRLKEQLSLADELRARLIGDDDHAMADFITWFEEWFVKRARPVEQAETT